MSEDFLVNASTEGLRPLGTAPQRSFELISSTVAARLGEAHGALFAEPVSSEHGDRYDWYSPVAGTPRRLADLPEAEQARARAELDRLTADIRGLAETLSAAGSGDDQRLGEALENALETPGADAVWVITGLPGDRLQPVLVNWAWVRDRQEAVRGALSGADVRRAAAAAAADAVAAAAAATASPAGETPRAADAPILLWWLVWLGWLILAAMIAVILHMMIAACALRLPGFAGACPVAAVAMESTPARDRLVLEDRILQLERQIWIADRACQPEPVAPEPVQQVELPPLQAVPTPPTAPTEADARMQASGARLGDLTFTLIWDSPDDLDLHVTCPAGQNISYRQKQACNGALDVDSNAERIVPQPIENVFFDSPASGVYRVQVQYYASQTGWTPRPFELQIRDQDRVETFAGVVSPARRVWETTYQARGR